MSETTPTVNVSETSDHATETPTDRNLVAALGRAIAAAAVAGRADVAGELAAIVGRLAAEERTPALEAAGVTVLDRTRAKR